MRMHSNALSSRVSRARSSDEVGVEGFGIRASSFKSVCLALDRRLEAFWWSSVLTVLMALWS